MAAGIWGRAFGAPPNPYLPGFIYSANTTLKNAGSWEIYMEDKAL